ncbi:hypothetical protein [Nitrosomonas sp.]|uniref:hypothetical protein n=1 Tax=Nitrosomonas sp. TaxID=42353 RepID=UPI001D1E3D0E|nr:hypothetical protein [Nitrosomonas sp.]MBX3616563.1 hypothetical protein [Nitrosomonas sp.]
MKVKTLAAAIITLGLAFAIPQTYASHSDGTNTSDLVHKADLIFEGKVVEVDYRTSDILQADDVAMPHTYVTYEITRNFKGSSSQDKLITLRFRGGPDDAGNTLIIPGVPLFQVGDQDIVFVRGNGVEISPVVGGNFGRFRIGKDAVHSDAWQEIWLRSNGQIDQGNFNEEKKSVTLRIGVKEFTFETESKAEWTPPADATKLTPVQFRKFLSDSVNQHYTPQALSTLKPAQSVQMHEQFAIGKAQPVAAPAVAPVLKKLDLEAPPHVEMTIHKD